MYNYYKRTKEEYEQCREKFEESNWNIVFGIQKVAILIVGCLFVISIFMPFLRKFSWIYAVTFVLLLLTGIWLGGSKKKRGILAAHVVISILYAFATALAMVYPEERSTVFPMLMALLPIMITDTVAGIAILNGGWCVLYSILILYFKKPDIQTYEIFTALIAMLIAIVSNVIIQEKLLRGYLSQEKSKEMIQELEQTREELKKKSETDTLTELLNRSAFIEKVEKLSGQEVTGYHALGILDIDGFKQVNDKLGHQEGDLLIRQVGHVLSRQLLSRDYSGRLGGDEFIFYLQARNTEMEIVNMAKQIHQKISEIQLSDGTRISLSIGVTILPEEGLSFDELYLRADTALYEVKNTGKNQIRFYNNQI